MALSDALLWTDFATSLTDNGFTSNQTRGQTTTDYVVVEQVNDAGLGTCCKNTFVGSTCNDNYFGVQGYQAWSSNALYYHMKFRFGDSGNAYSPDTATSDGTCPITPNTQRSHELKMPDIGAGQTATGRVIGKFRTDGTGIIFFRLYLEQGVSTGDTANHDLVDDQGNFMNLADGQVHTLQIGLIDNGASGDIVRMWLDNETEGSPDYEYTSTGDLILSSEWTAQNELSINQGYKNHTPVTDELFYFTDIAAHDSFITLANTPAPSPVGAARRLAGKSTSGLMGWI